MTIFGPILWVRQTESVELGEDPILVDAVHRYGLAWCIEDWGTTHTESKLSKHAYGAYDFYLSNILKQCAFYPVVFFSELTLSTRKHGF